MEIRALGPLEVLIDGSPQPLGGLKPQMLLAALLVEAGHAVSVDRLEFALWGDSPPKSSVHALHVHVSKLRSALEPDREAGSEGLVLQTSGDGYRIDLQPDQYDVTRFWSLIEAARQQTDPERAALDLDEALALWRGRPFGSLADEEVIRVEAVRLEQLRMDAVEDRFEAGLSAGHHARLASEIEEALAATPLRERLWGQLMVALYRSGRQAEALRAYGRVRDHLGEELGIEPGPELRDLETNILLQDPSLDLEGFGPSGNLPAPLTSFMGRQRELESISEALRAARLVTLSGPPGIGKSRLAVTAAAALSSGFPGGTWYIDVTEVDDIRLLASAIAHALGIDRHSEDDPVVAIASRIGERSLLLVLDGCEHVVDGVAGLVRRLLRGCPGLRVIVTSQVVLEIAGESVISVSPLEIDSDAVRLFRERAADADARYRDHPVDQAIAAQICERLEGVPLAIELAAVRVGVLSPQQVLERLDERLTLVQDGGGGRRRTLDAAIDWSVDLLPAPVRSVYGSLSVFRDGFDLDAATAVIGSDDVLDHLSVLVNHSLLTTEHRAGVVRYRMLDAVRQHAGSRLDSEGEGAAVEIAHGDYFAKLAAVGAKRLSGSDQMEWLLRLDADHGNIRAALGRYADAGDLDSALDLATNISWFWFLRSHLREGWHWLERLIDAASDRRSITYMRTLIAASQFAWEQGANDRAREWLTIAADLARDIGSTTHLAWTTAYLALLDLMEEADTEADTRAGEARALFEQMQNAAGIGFTTWLEVLARLASAWRSGEIEPDVARASEETLETLMTAATAIGDRNLVGHLEWTLGMLAHLTGAPDQARRRLAIAARNLIELGNHSCLCHVLDSLALVWVDRGDPEQAARLIGMVESLRARIGNPGHVSERDMRQTCRDQVVAALGKDCADELIDSGRGAPLDEVLSVAWDAGT